MNVYLRVASLLTILGLNACASSSRIDGEVVDIWGHPIEGVTVILSGVDERPTTDSKGRFHLPEAVGELKLKAGKEGYIQEHLDLQIEEGEKFESLRIELYPQPEKVGFYLVGEEAYEHIEPRSVHHKGNELKDFQGLQEIGERVSADTDLRVVFHTDLSLDQVMRLNFELHRLSYLNEVEVPGPLDMERVRINLWRSEGRVDIDIAPMHSRSDYLFSGGTALDAGPYAFNTQGLLNPRDAETFMAIPEPLRVAFPFQIADGNEL